MDTNLGDIVANLGFPRILVLGDIILDRYVSGHAERVSPEAPVLVLHADEEEVRLGGAASVAWLLRNLKADVILAGVVGDDSGGRVIRALLADGNIDQSGILSDPDRMTTTKDRFIGRAANRHASQMLRVDREVRDPIQSNLEDRLIETVVNLIGGIQVLLISDYAKGVCTPRVLRFLLAAAASRQIPVFVDPARITDYERYRGATLLLPNRAEAESAAKHSIHTIQDALTAAKSISEQHNVPAVLVKLDRDGMVLVRTGFRQEILPARPRPVYDVTGAGDMVLAIVGMCQACGVSWQDTMRIANVAAGLEVEKPGVTPVTREEICDDIGRNGGISPKIVTLVQLTKIAASHRRNGERIVFTNGCFDLLHIGHITYLQEASELGELLIVGINSDDSVRRLKGRQRPIIQQHHRARMLAALGFVSHVIIFEQDTPHEILHTLRPEFLVKGGTYTPDEVVGHEVVSAYGGNVRVLSLVEGVSTTKIIGDLVRVN